MKKILSIFTILLMSFLIVACGDTKPDVDDDDNGGIVIPPIDDVEPTFNYYEQTLLNEDKHIYVFNTLGVETLTNDQAFAAQAIQGLFARDAVKFYFDGRSVTNMLNTDRYHFMKTVEDYNLTYEDITLEQGIQMYIEAWDDFVEQGIWGSQIPLSDFNNIPGIDAYTETSGEGYQTPGFIVYRRGTVSVNIAATLAGITGFLPVELADVQTYLNLGLVQKFNVDNIVFDYRWVFQNTLSEINPEGLIHQNYSSPGGTTNTFLKDYGITQKYMHVYYDSQVNAPDSFRRSLHNFLSPNRPILGYAFSEDRDVEFFSQYGQFLVPTDFSFNLSYLLAETFRKDENGQDIQFTQPNQIEVTEAENDKHYVAFIVSDGDNATMWQNTAPFATNFMNAVGRDNDDFKVTWSLTPSMADLMPSVLDSIYNDIANENDSFAVPVSGHGYVNAGGFMRAGDGAYFADFLSKLDVYMRKADLGIVTVIGAQNLQERLDTLEGYASVESVKGGIVYDGHKYFGGVRGGIYWANGKPFVGPRDSLWETTPEYIAARLNMYPTDPTVLDGYSIINVHPWSHSYEDIRTIVNMLEDHVEVVSIDEIFHLMTHHIENQTNDGGYRIPALNGISITEQQLRNNPELIPVNPLFNDFLLWEEDWTALSGSIAHSSSDPANSNVGNFITSLRINGLSTAIKNPFTIPNIDDVWVSFVARADSTNPTDVSRIKISMKVNDEWQTVVEEAVFRGVSGTETASSINGDGWQFIAFPIGQYFENYRGQLAQVQIEVLGSTALKIDRFEISQKVPTPNGNFDPMNNQFLDGNTEDWLLGHVFMTSQYYYFGAVDKDTGIPFGGGSIQTDTSDGGGDEKRNANTNLWMAKTYQLPESGEISITYDIDGGEDSGPSYMISLYVHGRLIILTPWNRIVGNTEPITINLSQLVPELNLNGATVTVVIQARDSGVNNGVGETLHFRSFITQSND
jgi:hypothetical protein